MWTENYFKVILTFLLYFWSNKCSLGEHNRRLSETWKYLTDPKLYKSIVYNIQYSKSILLRLLINISEEPVFTDHN